MLNLKDLLSYWITSTWLCPGTDAFHASRSAFRNWAEAHGWTYVELPEGCAEIRCTSRTRLPLPDAAGQMPIKVRLRYDPYREIISITAGHTGLPLKTRPFKARCVGILQELEQTMQVSGCTESAQQRQQRLLRLTTRLAGLNENHADRSSQTEHAHALYKIITGYGEQSPANIACAENLALITDFDQRGLGTGSGTLLSMITNAAESCEPPAPLARKFPDLTAEEWSATLRICTLLLLDLETTLPAPKNRR